MSDPAKRAVVEALEAQRNGDAAPRSPASEQHGPPSGRPPAWDGSDEPVPVSRRRFDSGDDIPPPSFIEAPENRPPGSKDPYLGTTFDHRYKVERLLGEGGMGFVYLARHKVIDKKVAIKVLRADMARDREILDRFLQEAKAASSIGNPHIIDISDFGDLPDGSTYFVMEYLEGKSIIQLTDKEKRLPIDRIAHIAIQMAHGLAAAHAAGIIHRDLKPENIFVVTRGNDKDFIKILDFGIAKVSTSADTRLTRAGAVFGTPHYMSPEQAAGAPLDHRTDIYSMGVMLYELVSGQLPFVADNFMGILSQHMYQAPVPLREICPPDQCPPSLEALVLKCMSKAPEARYADMDALAADLERLRAGEVTHAVAEMMSRTGGFSVPHDFFKKKPPAAAPAKRSSRRYLGLAGLLAATGAGAAVFALSSSPPRPAPTQEPPAAQATAAPAAEHKVLAVALVADPEHSVGIRDGQPIKLPVVIEVEEGKPVKVEIKADDYQPQTVELDGKEPSVRVKLDPIAREIVLPEPSLRPAPGTKPPGAAAGGTKKGGDVVDPWSRKPR
jgi:serine/threonine-protein kinase